MQPCCLSPSGVTPREMCRHCYVGMVIGLIHKFIQCYMKDFANAGLYMQKVKNYTVTLIGQMW